MDETAMFVQIVQIIAVSVLVIVFGKAIYDAQAWLERRCQRRHWRD